MEPVKIAESNDAQIQKQSPIPDTPVTLKIQDSPAIQNNLISSTPREKSPSEGKEIKKESDLEIPSMRLETKPSKNTIWGAGFMMTNMCLGSTILTFAIRAKYFGLTWLLVASVLCAAINYWTIVRAIDAGKNFKEAEYSFIVGKILGDKARKILNILILVYSYVCLLTFLTLIYPFTGRFIQSIFYTDKYPTYEKYEDKVWGKPQYKFPIMLGVCIVLIPICCMTDMSKLNWTGYLGIVGILYTLLIVTIQCKGYYDDYKKNIYVENDKSTHPNWYDLTKAFTSELEFFKGMSALFAAYSCHTAIFPVYETFKYYPNGQENMNRATLFSVTITTLLHFLSMVTSFLTDPYDPQDLIIYRQNRKKDKDIAMNICKLLSAIAMVLTTPGYFFGLRNCVANIFTEGKITKKFNYLLTSISMICCTIIAITYDKILNYLNYLGGFFSPFICYLFPILMYIKSNGKGWGYWKNIVELTGSLILVAIGLIAGVATIRDDVRGK